MASEFGIEQPVKQPPALTVPQTKRQKAGARMDKRRAIFVKGWMARRRAGHKANMKAQNAGIRKANAGARMNRRRIAFSNQQRIAVKKEARGNARVHKNMQRYGRVRVQQLRQYHRANLASIRASNQGIRASKRAIKMHQRKQRAASPRVRARQFRRAQNTALKFSNLLYLARLAKKAFAKKKMDGRNHGFTGVKSGKGLTGLAGRR